MSPIIASLTQMNPYWRRLSRLSWLRRLHSFEQENFAKILGRRADRNPDGAKRLVFGRRARARLALPAVAINFSDF